MKHPRRVSLAPCLLLSAVLALSTLNLVALATSSIGLEPDVCDGSGLGDAAAQFVNYEGKQPLMLKVSKQPQGEFEAAYGEFETISGTTWTSVQMDVAGTSQGSGFGPYLDMFIEVPGQGLKEVYVALSSGQSLGKGDLPNSKRRSFTPGNLGYPSNCTIESAFIEAGQVGGTGLTYIDNTQVNGTKVNKIMKVLNCGQ